MFRRLVKVWFNHIFCTKICGFRNHSFPVKAIIKIFFCEEICNLLKIKEIVFRQLIFHKDIK